MREYVPPELDLDGFNCPHCGAFAHQEWYSSVEMASEQRGRPYRHTVEVEGVTISQCGRCKANSIWIDDALVSPRESKAPLASAEMPEDVRRDYDEAREVVAVSPRSAAALLRLAIQKLCIALGEPGGNLNEDIGALVKKGLPAKLQQALDVVRVVGNNAVHPGELDLRDDSETAMKLFGLVNLIVEAMIVQPKAIEAMFKGLPTAAREAIEKRDR
jgi:hypothetical protein